MRGFPTLWRLATQYLFLRKLAPRSEAFNACRELIDMLKASVPIWKHQRFDDGTAEWVGTP